MTAARGVAGRLADPELDGLGSGWPLDLTNCQVTSFSTPTPSGASRLNTAWLSEGMAVVGELDRHTAAQRVVVGAGGSPPDVRDHHQVLGDRVDVAAAGVGADVGASAQLTPPPPPWRAR